MVSCLVVPQKCVHAKDELSLDASRLQFQKNLLQNEEELVANTVLATVATARQAVKEVSRRALALSQRGTEPLKHVKEELLIAGQTHAKVEQVEASRSSETIDEAILDSLLDLVNREFRLEQSKNGDRGRAGVELALGSKVDDGALGGLHFLPLLEAIGPVKLAVFRLRLLAFDQDVHF